MTAASHLQDKTQEIDLRYYEHSMTRSALEAYLKMAGEITGMLMSNLKRAAELIQSFKQVAVDQASEEKRVFKLKEYLDDVLLSLRPRLKRTQSTVTVSCPEDIEIESYPGAFSQILTNFIMNSLIHGATPESPLNINIHAFEERGGDFDCATATMEKG